MNRKQFSDLVKNELQITLTETMMNQLEIYANFLLEYNSHTNLTAIKTKEEVYMKHFFDSLTLVKIASFGQETLLDIGTGAGFPGLVLAICFPKLQVTLLDSNNKKTTFLKECIIKLGLTNVQVETKRAEDYTKIHREEYDYVTSRAVSDLRILLELNIPALKVNGYFLAMKGNVVEELENSLVTMNILDCKLLKSVEFDLPNDLGHRTLLKIEKQKVTNSIYPRSYDKIKKHELKQQKNI